MTVRSTTRWVPVREFLRRHPEAGGKNFVYEACRRGLLRSVRIAGKVLVDDNALDLLAVRQNEQRS